MKKINALKEKRNAELEKLKGITAKAEGEKRFKTSEELEEWNALKTSISEIDAEIATLEEEARLMASVIEAEFRSEENPENKEARKYDLAKALREARTGNFTGFEKEVQEEGVKEYARYGQSVAGIVIPKKIMRAFTAAGNTGHHSEIQSGIDIIADRSLLASLGVTTYEGLTSQMKLVFSQGFNAAFYDEDEAAGEGAVTEVNGKIEPRRIQGWSNFSNEFLAQSATMPVLMADMTASIEAATAKEILDQILALAALTGFDSAAAGAALTWKNVMKLKGAIKSAQFVAPKFVAGGELYASLEATNKDAGSGKMIIEDSKISGYSAVDVQGLIASGAKNSLIFGDFSKAHAGYFGGVEILVDPYTGSNAGKTKLTYHRLGDVAVNPYAFKSIQNASIA